jgi:hypothetical protein
MADRRPFLLRIDSELWSDLESWAQDELRSINGQIEYVLRQAVQKRKGGKAAHAIADSRKLDHEDRGRGRRLETTRKSR